MPRVQRVKGANQHDCSKCLYAVWVVCISPEYTITLVVICLFSQLMRSVTSKKASFAGAVQVVLYRQARSQMRTWLNAPCPRHGVQKYHGLPRSKWPRCINFFSIPDRIAA